VKNGVLFRVIKENLRTAKYLRSIRKMCQVKNPCYLHLRKLVTVLGLLRYRDSSNNKVANPMKRTVAISEQIHQIMLINGGNCDNIKIIP
jgi:hypothetical protein